MKAKEIEKVLQEIEELKAIARRKPHSVEVSNWGKGFTRK